MAQNKPKRLYQVWKGNNKFFCGGRLILGPDASSLILSVILIAGPAIAFCVKIYMKIIDVDSNDVHWYPVLIGGAILTILDLILLFLTSTRDPGIVPRSSSPPEFDETNDVTPSMEWINGRATPHMRLPRTKDVIVNNHQVKVKYCDTCMLYRPPRASHCSICNNCVQGFDHHCPWVGQCIGVRNYRFFFTFITTSTLLCIYVFAFSLIMLFQARGGFPKAIKTDILSTFLIVYCFVAVWFVGGLSIFHFYLICTNQTTYENFRYRYDKKENPYNKGTIENLREIFFSKIPPSMNKFRFLVDNEHTIVGAMTPNREEGIPSSKEKIDIEMGTNLVEHGDFPLPEILHNLGGNDLIVDLKTSEEEGKPAFDPLYPTGQEVGESVRGASEPGECSGSRDGDRVAVGSSTSIS